MGIWSREVKPEGEQLLSLLVVDVEGPPGSVRILEAGIGSGRDTILDFVRGSDKIDLAGIDATAGTTTNDAFGFIGTAAFSGVAGQLRYELFDAADMSFTLVQGDVNGDGIADFEVQINGLVPLTTADFVL